MRIRLWHLPAVLILACVGLYVLNPLDLPSKDPRARVFGFASFIVPSESMAPTLRTNDLILVSTWAYALDEPQRGDLIAFRPPLRDTIFVMRLIGLPGEKVAMHDDQVLIDDHPLVEPYLYRSPLAGLQRRQQMAERELGADEFLVLGDHRRNSNDSRYWGALPRADLLGKVTQIVRREDRVR
jgi:signal peptidase I